MLDEVGETRRLAEGVTCFVDWFEELGSAGGRDKNNALRAADLVTFLHISS
jgi:hypothetical protein